MTKTGAIQIVTYNIFYDSNPTIIAQNILTMKKDGADIFCLQEVVKIQQKPFVGDAIRTLLGKGWGITYNLGNEDSRVCHGVAIVWNTNKFHLLETKKVSLPKLAQLSISGKFFECLFGTKNIEPKSEALTMKFSMDNTVFRVTSVHFGFSLRMDYRLKQHTFLKKELAKENVPYEIICGDFNTIRGITYKSELKMIQEVYGVDFIETCSHISWTQDLHYSVFTIPLFTKLMRKSRIHYHQKLDHIYIKGFRYADTERVNLAGSDHYPLTTTVRLGNHGAV